MRADGERVLVIEDDMTLAMGLELNLTAEGFRVLIARDGREGLRQALDERPDLVVLDLMLPGIDGFQLLSELRERGREMPVIILSARGEEQSKLAGFGVGADDYVTKPFSLKELLARVHAVFRRPRLGRAADPPLRFGELEIDLDGRRVMRAGVDVAVSSREFELLAYLVRRRGRVQSREGLLAAVWGYDYNGTARTVDNFVRSLRVKLEADPSQPRHLVTVRGAGYRFDG